jgi:hypothetical protein
MTPVSIDHHDLKDYRYLEDELNTLGHRLDLARSARQRVKTDWGRNYWNTVLEQLTTQWQRLPVLHEIDAVGTNAPRWSVRYDFYEQPDVMESPGSAERAIGGMLRRPDLDSSWHRHHAERLSRAPQ